MILADLLVPSNREFDDSDLSVWFDKILVDETEYENNVIGFEYHGNVKGPQSDNFSVTVDIKKRTVKGDGSRRFREFILDDVLYWYLKAKSEDRYKDLLIH